MCFFLFSFLRRLYEGSFKVHSVIEGKVQKFPVPFCPRTCVASPTVNIPHQSGALVGLSEPAWARRNYPKSVVYFRLHSWCCMFSGFGQMYNDM